MKHDTDTNVSIEIERADIHLDQDARRRLLIAFILRHQNALSKKGLTQEGQALASLIIGQSSAAIDAIAVTEDVLGFDSLGILDLITALNRFFGLSASGVEDYFLVKRRIGEWIDLLGHHAQSVEDRWTFGFQTSGSVGPPKLVQHAANVLWTEMKAQAEEPFAHIKAPARIISLVPPYHIYGFLFSCVLPGILGMKVIDLHISAPGRAFFHARPGDLIIGTPFHWDLLAKTGQQFCGDVFGATSAGPSTAQTWEAAKTTKLARLTEIYGASETGGIGHREAWGTAFKMLSHLSIKNNVLHRNEGLTAFEPQDRLEWVSPLEFNVAGRLDNVVQVAGVNVSPQLVQEKLLQTKGVAEVAVRHDGERLHAFVVPSAGQDEATLAQQLQVDFTACLAPPARPATLTFGAHLPLSAMGKTSNWI